MESWKVGSRWLGAVLVVALLATGGSATAQEPPPAEPSGATATPNAVEVSQLSPVADALARGDAAWARRADGASGGRAAEGPIREAVAAYEEALGADPESFAAAWRLMRAVWFLGEYALTDADARKQVFDRGKRAGDAAFAALSRQVGRRLDDLAPAARAAAVRTVPEAAALHFWAAVDWGVWGEVFGKLAAARQGVAGRIRDLTAVVIALDPAFEQAGGHRVLGRLHARAPSIPFFTGWIDRDVAVRELAAAVAAAPASSFNQLYLAEAILAHRAGRRAEAEAALRAVLALTPETTPDGAVELAANQQRARRLLAGEKVD